MAKRAKSLPKWSPHSLWLAQCSRRLWLHRPPMSLRPPTDPKSILGQTIHQVIRETLTVKVDIKFDEIRQSFIKRYSEALVVAGYDDIDDDIRNLFRIGSDCLHSFHHLYLEKNERKNSLSTEQKVAIIVNRTGQLIYDRHSKGMPAYELFGRLDEVSSYDKTLIIRDFKLTYKTEEEPQFRYKLQFGIYQTCLQPFLTEKGFDTICCEIVDLSHGQFIEIESFSTGKIHGLVKEAEKRILARSQGRNENLCPTCPYQPICDNPYNPPLEWKKSKSSLSQLNLAF